MIPAGSLTGIAASPGVAVGPVYRLETEELGVREAEVEACDIEKEVAAFTAALEASRRDLAAIRDGIAAELGEDAARIYDAHLMILDDPEMIGAVERGVRDKRRNAAFVFQGVMGSVAARFENFADEYLRERRSDILDCERRVLRHLLGTGRRSLDDLREPMVIVAHDLGPSEVAMLPRGKVLAFVLEVGGRTSHGAIVARGRGIPAVVSVKGALQAVRPGDRMAVDGFAGTIEVNPDPAREVHYKRRLERLRLQAGSLQSMLGQPAVTLDGHAIELGANLELPSDAPQAAEAGADGIGLFRTEFFYLNRVDLPSEEEQYAAYRGVTESMNGKPVIFRTMDLGGDKVASYLGMTHETNPFLGLRGIRLALASPEMFRTQIRAIYRASAHGRVRIMFPMVSSVEELLRTLELRDEVLADLKANGIAHDPDVETGIMIETPSAVWMADALAKHSQFFSIGSNDLIQYTLAMDRDNERLAHLYEPLDPAVLRSIQHTVRCAHAAGRWVGVCGEMAGDPHTAVLLVGLGVDELSVSCYDLPRVKAAIRSVRYETARAVAEEAVACPSAAPVRALVRDRIGAQMPSYLAVDRDSSSAAAAAPGTATATGSQGA
ncbi:MAG: phosphoenolpyruvate--protein phosphotransferase [Candidatus Eisenbacteria bacterium]